MDLTFTIWHDPVVEQHGYPAASPYVRLFWLPVLGPSATLLYQSTCEVFEYEPYGFTHNSGEIGCQLGLGVTFGKNAPLRRAIERCVRFGVFKRTGPASFAVRRFVSPLSEHHLGQLSPSLQELHAAYRSEATFESK